MAVKLCFEILIGLACAGAIIAAAYVAARGGSVFIYQGY